MSNPKEDVKSIYKHCVACYNGHMEKVKKRWYIQLTIHHIVPRSKRGADSVANYISLCRNCHDNYHEYLSKLHIHLSKYPEFTASLLNFIILQNYYNLDGIEKDFDEFDNAVRNRSFRTAQEILERIYDNLANPVYRTVERKLEIDSKEELIDIASDLYDVLHKIMAARAKKIKDIYIFGLKLEYPNYDHNDNLKNDFYRRSGSIDI
ncbi:MAG: HNH endonuclease signature motif containing protein [Candidatus Anstonellales archaeon]